MMDHPEFDADGYPTDATLETIRRWNFTPLVLADMEAMMDYAGEAWRYPEYWSKERGFVDPDYSARPCVRYVFSTGGWSGNESVVAAIEAHHAAQALGAWSWRRGGHYEYRFPVESGE